MSLCRWLQGKGVCIQVMPTSLINSSWAQTKAAHPLIMPCLWARSAAQAWLGMVSVPDLCAARAGNVSLHGGSISVPCRTVFKCWGTVLNDEIDGKGEAELLWWGRNPWVKWSAGGRVQQGVQKGQTNPGPDLHFVSPNHLCDDVPPWPELIPITSEVIDLKKEEIKTSTVTWNKNAITKFNYGQGNVMLCICCKPEEGFECQKQPAVMFETFLQNHKENIKRWTQNNVNCVCENRLKRVKTFKGKQKQVKALTSLVCSDWQEQDRKPYKQFLFGIMLHVSWLLQRRIITVVWQTCQLAKYFPAYE